MRKIYFAGSIRGGRDDVELYMGIIKHLQNYGQVLTEHLGDKSLSSKGENLSDRIIHDRDMAWLDESNVIVAEVTQVSSGVGYEIGRIVERNLWVPKNEKKDILCLNRPRPQPDRKLSGMLGGSNGVVRANYQTLTEARSAIDYFFETLDLV